MTTTSSASPTDTAQSLTSAELIAAAEKLVPMLQESARAAEQARRPLDEVIGAVQASGLFAAMVPAVRGGHEADLDTFFEVALTLSKADPAMGWLIGFYIEHNLWFASFGDEFQNELFGDANYQLAPATLNVGAGTATPVDGGYQLNGQWQWGTGIIHAEWVMVGALTKQGDSMVPIFFAMPREEVEAVDTWHMLGMCGTGSWDIRIDDLFVPTERTVSMIDLVNATGNGASLYDGPLYRTPLLPVLAFAAGVPMLGAAHLALDTYRAQAKAKIEAATESMGGDDRNRSKPAVAAKAALSIEAAELLMRDVLADVMTQRNAASLETRSGWLSKISHAVFMCREAVQDISSVTGASGGFLDNPIQKALRDITTGSNHVIFDREQRYADYGHILLDQPIQNLMV